MIRNISPPDPDNTGLTPAMLKPFQIRNLRVSEQELADSRSPSGVVQISSTDYDDLATTHPRARLTYIDEDRR